MELIRIGIRTVAGDTHDLYQLRPSPGERAFELNPDFDIDAITQSRSFQLAAHLLTGTISYPKLENGKWLVTVPHTSGASIPDAEKLPRNGVISLGPFERTVQ